MSVSVSVCSPGRAGVHVALLEFGLGLDVLGVVVAVLVHHHAVAAQVKALRRGQLVACGPITSQPFKSAIHLLLKRRPKGKGVNPWSLEYRTLRTSVNFVDENYDEKYSLTTFFP